jgi:hypothetical protein
MSNEMVNQLMQEELEVMRIRFQTGISIKLISDIFHFLISIISF